MPQGLGAAGLDAANSLNDALYRLGFQGPADLAASEWTSVEELYAFADDAGKRLSRVTGAFVTWDGSITVTPATAVYLLQATQVFTAYAWLSGAELRITRVRDLESLDGNWPSTSSPSTRCCFDAGSVGTITLYPNPTVGGTLEQVCGEWPATIALGSSTVPMAAVAQDYFTYAMLAGARGKESEAAMPEMASHYLERLRLYEKVFEHLWGPGQ